MYSEIASNKRRSVVFIALFFVIWLAIGAVVRPALQGGAPALRSNNGYGHPAVHYGWGPVIVGMVDLRPSWPSAGSSTR